MSTTVNIYENTGKKVITAVDDGRGTVAMWQVIATEAALFVALFSSYFFLGNNKSRWAVNQPPKLHYPLIMLAIMIISCVVLCWGERLVRRQNYFAARIALAVTFLLGLGFLAVQSFAYLESWTTLTPYSDSYGSNYIAGTPYLGASVRMYPGPGGYQGELVAWDVEKRKEVWGIKDPVLPVYAGVLGTGGDFVFYGTMEGWFRAVDARTGKILWQSKTSSGIIGDPITFLGPDGRQYIAIFSGIGGWMGATALPSLSTDDPYGALGAVGAMKPIKGITQPGAVLYVFGY